MSMKPSAPPDNRVLPNISIPMRGLRLLSGVNKGIRYM
jgi:hypothetical protein